MPLPFTLLLLALAQWGMTMHVLMCVDSGVSFVSPLHECGDMCSWCTIYHVLGCSARWSSEIDTAPATDDLVKLTDTY